MNIIKLALKAGWDGVENHINIEAFANLVAAQEREACAKACERLMDVHYEANQWESYKTADVLAQAIRARGTT
jgi:hypothetical protein